MNEPAGFWDLTNGSYQPVAHVPSWGEMLRNKVLYGWKFIPFTGKWPSLDGDEESNVLPK